jgi:Uncharacterized conserved protein
MWSSRVQKSTSGKRQSIGYMTYPLYQWTLQFNVLREYASLNELETLQGFFNTMNGQVDTFLFGDPNDAAVAAYQTIGVGNGVNKNFQLARAYGGFVEPVYAPNTYTVRKAGAVQAEPAAFTMGANGLVQFVTAPTAGQVVDWLGSFRYRCAFTQDSIELINDGVDIWKSNKITFESIKP